MADRLNFIQDTSERVIEADAMSLPGSTQASMTTLEIALEAKMAAADMRNYTRGDDKYFEIMLDLEKLSKLDPDAANGLWDKHAGKGVEKPVFLDTEKEISGQQVTPPEPGRAAAEQAPITKATEPYQVPDSVAKLYLQAKDGFYFRDGDNRKAFEDRGKHLVTEHNDENVAKSMIAVAKAKGWKSIKLSGHDDFKSQAWLEAQLHGIDTTGYRPRDVDLAKLEELRNARLINKIEHAPEREKAAAAQPELAAAAPGADKSAAQPAPSPEKPVEIDMRGVLLEHGKAPYQFDETNKKDNYYVKLQTENGVKTHWGVDLERAIDESKKVVGDKIELEFLGKQPVTVQENVLGGKDGKEVIGTRPLDTFRNEWKVSQLDAQAKAIEAPTKAQDGPQGSDKVVSEVFADILQKNGYKPKTIERVLKQAQAELAERAAKGEPPLNVQMYDKNAGRSTPAPKIEKQKSKEAERTR